jgi:hypothetical protein
VSTTGGGQVVQQAPVFYQAINGARQAVTGQTVLSGPNQAGFLVGPYDASQPLIIDPTLAFSTYLGGNGNDYANGIAVDGAGDAFLTGTTSSNNFPTTYGFDDASRVTSIVSKSSSGSTLSAYTYTYDNANRLSSAAHWSQVGTTTYSGTSNYSYDAASQLLGDGANNYSYDANGNRTMSGYQTGAGNRLTTDGLWTYTYDAAGNVTQKQRGATGRAR